MVNKTLNYERVESLSGTFYDDGAFLASSDQYVIGEGTQNYVISTANTCPTISSLATTEHQNCRTSGGNSVGAAQRALNCPP
jgi:hypothetical protein